MKAIALAFTMVAAASMPAAADRCTDQHPEGMPSMQFLQKTRFELQGGARSDSWFATVSAEKLLHPQVEAGLRANYAHPMESSGDAAFELLAEGRVFPLMVTGGTGTDGVCGTKGHDWRLDGAPYVAIGLGGWAVTSFEDGGFTSFFGLGWDEVLGHRLSIFLEGGRVIASGRDDRWSIGGGVRF